MTEQYQEESINGQPSPLSLISNISGGLAAPGVIDTEAIWWSTLAVESAIAGSGIEVAGSAAVGSIIQFTQPGLFSVLLQIQNTVAPTPLNILRGATTLPITAGNGYPADNFVPGFPGVEAVFSIFNGQMSAISAEFRITGADLVDPDVGVNPNRQLRFSYPAANIPTLDPLRTRLTINRVSR